MKNLQGYLKKVITPFLTITTSIFNSVYSYITHICIYTHTVTCELLLCMYVCTHTGDCSDTVVMDSDSQAESLMQVVF